MEEANLEIAQVTRSVVTPLARDTAAYEEYVGSTLHCIVCIWVYLIFV